MNQKAKRAIFLLLIISSLVVTTNFYLNKSESIDPFFTLVAKTNDGTRAEYLNLMKQYLIPIGINLDIIIQDWPTFVGELIIHRDFDICYVALSGGEMDPDFTGVYNENGSLNLFGYDISMDYNATLGTGLNEWYLRQGRLIMPPNSQDRIQHYWDWEQYLMDEICPLLPTFTPTTSVAYWNNLQGYNITNGLLQSWGKMNWTSTHLGQINQNEVVIADISWSDLNPLFQDDSASRFISSTMIDPLVWYDGDLKAWPHIVKNWTHISDTQVRLKIREGIKWAEDPDGLFPNEYLDVEDVYFTIFATRIRSSDITEFYWLDYMEIIDDYTIDLFIDGDHSTPEKEPEATYLTDLVTIILPEHYLNQTQLSDGKTPDITHSSWNTFATEPFGTGLFTFDNFTEGIETVLTLNPDSWWLNSSITSDPDLEWENRFGTFNNCPDSLRVKIINDSLEGIQLFQQGLLDIVDLVHPYTEIEDLTNKEYICKQDELTFSFGFFGFNMREVRPQIGSREPCPNDPSITKGLAIRKAICYAIDRNEINSIIHGGKMAINDYPICQRMGIWLNPNIIKYNYDLTKAIEYIELAIGIVRSTASTNQLGITFLILGFMAIATCLRTRKIKLI